MASITENYTIREHCPLRLKRAVRQNDAGRRQDTVAENHGLRQEVNISKQHAVA